MAQPSDENTEEPQTEKEKTVQPSDRNLKNPGRKQKNLRHRLIKAENERTKLILMVLALCLFFSGCGKQETGTAQEIETMTGSMQESNTEYEVPESAAAYLLHGGSPYDNIGYASADPFYDCLLLQMYMSWATQHFPLISFTKRIKS